MAPLKLLFFCKAGGVCLGLHDREVMAPLKRDLIADGVDLGGLRLHDREVMAPLKPNDVLHPRVLFVESP